MSSISIDAARVQGGLYIGTPEEAKSDLKNIQESLRQKSFRSGHLHLVTDAKGRVQFQQKSFFQRWREGSASTKEKDDETAAFVTNLIERAYSKPGTATPRGSLITRDSSITARESSVTASSFAPALPYRRLTTYLTRTDNRVGTRGLLGILEQSERDHEIRDIEIRPDDFEGSLKDYFKSRGMLVSDPEQKAPSAFKRSQRWYISLDRPQESYIGSLFSFNRGTEAIDNKSLEKTINTNELTVIEVRDGGSSSFYSVPKGKYDAFIKKVSGQRRVTLHLVGSLRRIESSPQRSSRSSFSSNNARPSITLSTIARTSRSSSPIRDFLSSERESRGTFSSLFRRSPSPENDSEEDSVTYQSYADPNAKGGLAFRPVRPSESIQKNRASSTTPPSSPKTPSSVSSK